LEVSANAGPYLAPAARDKLDLRVARQSVNLWQATVVATACHRASMHAEQQAMVVRLFVMKRGAVPC
jgi:hypothetical protein